MIFRSLFDLRAYLDRMIDMGIGRRLARRM